MGEKIKCEECGAKNNSGVRRCRVCANLLDIEAPEIRRGLAMSLGELDAWAAAEAEAANDPHDPVEFDMPGVEPINLDGVEDPAPAPAPEPKAEPLPPPPTLRPPPPPPPPPPPHPPA